jgi:GTPase involved in cell partitioning and DNA repair
MTDSDIQKNGWGEWSKYVLKELERLNACIFVIDAKLDKTLEDIVTIKGLAKEYEKALEDLKKNQIIISDKLDKVSSEVVALKIKAGAWGLLAGAIPVIILIAVQLLT